MWHRLLPALGRSFAALAILAALGQACARRVAAIELDPQFSLNIARAPKGFPADDASLTEAQRATLARRGRPQFIRFWWRADGEPVSAAGFSQGGANMADSAKGAKRSWIYWTEREKIEVVFDGQGAAREAPLGEKIELICRRGDPDTRAIVPGQGAAPARETWIWAEPGLQVEFEDGRAVRTAKPNP